MVQIAETWLYGSYIGHVPIRVKHTYYRMKPRIAVFCPFNDLECDMVQGIYFEAKVLDFVKCESTR